MYEGVSANGLSSIRQLDSLEYLIEMPPKAPVPFTVGYWAL